MKADRRGSGDHGRVGRFSRQVSQRSATVRHLVAIGAAILLALISPAMLLADAHRAAKRVDAAAMVLRDTLSGSDAGIPEGLLKRAECVGVFPSVWKGSFGFRGQIRQGGGELSDCRSRLERAGHVPH